ncbi:MAG: hypothetical protein QOK24_315 [Verrucomicrobiota bacterium]
MDGSEKTFRNNSASGMPALWPRIGKHQVKDINGSRRKERMNCAGNIAAQDAGVGQLAHHDFATGTSGSSEQTLDPKEIVSGIRRRGGGQKRAIAATKINLQRRGPTKQFVQIQRRQRITQHDFRLECGRRDIFGDSHLIQASEQS